MKIIFSLLLFVFCSVECNQKHLQALNVLQEDIVIIYEASTRGFYEKTWITRDSISFSTDRNLKEIVTSKCKSDDWNELMGFLNEVELESLPQLEPPTKMHQVDGAPMATLSIKKGDEIYETKVFDHEHPPKAISQLVNKVLSIKEIMTKQ